MKARPRVRTLIDRRELIRGGIALTTGLLLGARPARGQETGARVIVIGAGIAGVTAARALRASGLVPTVLEGRDRIGGRIWTNRELGIPVDLGASWIHGIEGNPITAIVGELGLETVETNYEDVLLFDHDGTKLGKEGALEVRGEFMSILEGLAGMKDGLEQDVSIGAALEIVIAEELGEDGLDADDQRMLQWATEAQVVTAAEEMTNLSLRYFGEEGGFAGGDRFFPGGYDKVVEALAKGLDIKLGHTVTKIEHTDGGVRLTTSKGVVEADACVVTLPLGVLKSGAVGFAPDLPERKRQAIQRLAMGTLNKVVLSFEKPFWPDRHFLAYAAKKKGLFPTVLNLGKAGAPALMGFTGGDFARGIESMTDERVGGAFLDVLRSMFGKAVPDPKGMVMARWNSDPFAGGAYSHVPVGASFADYDALAAPTGRLFFAGEATTKKYFGTVHGAHLSGLRAAKEVLAAVQEG